MRETKEEVRTRPMHSTVVFAGVYRSRCHWASISGETVASDSAGGKETAAG